METWLYLILFLVLIAIVWYVISVYKSNSGTVTLFKNVFNANTAS